MSCRHVLSVSPLSVVMYLLEIKNNRHGPCPQTKQDQGTCGFEDQPTIFIMESSVGPLCLTGNEDVQVGQRSQHQYGH